MPNSNMPDGPTKTSRFWADEISSARKREKSYLNQAENSVKLYEAEDPNNRFNIVYSNTETLSPAVYNSTPRADVQPRYRNDTPSARAAAGLCQSYLTFFLDSSDPRYPSFDELMLHSVLGALVPGRGVVRFSYAADIEYDVDKQPINATNECIHGESIDYNRVLFGYAKTWRQVPWIAFEHIVTKDEAEEILGDEDKGKAARISYTDQKDSSHDPETPKVKDSEGAHLGVLYEIWHKKSRKRIFFSPGSEAGVLAVKDDPLELEGFFPICKPLMMFTRLTSMVPVPLYQQFLDQARELNRITIRIQKLIEACKIRGFYDSTIDGIEQALQADDGILIPAKNVAALGQNSRIESGIFLFPIEKIVPVLQQLYLQREQIKQVIYEITGISDILRGASVASETATAQNLKNQWGSLRLKRFQKEVARFVRDNLRLVAEIAFTKLKPETIVACTGSRLPTPDKVQQAQMIVQQAEAAGQEPPPEAGQILAMPSLMDTLALLSSDLHRRYNIDIETNSTIDAEATEDKQSINEFMTAFGQLMAALGPLVENGTLPFEAGKKMMLAIAKRFRFGREVEDELRLMVQPQQGGPEAEKLQKETEALEQEREKFKEEQRKAQEGLQKQQFQLKMQEMQLKLREMLMKAQAQIQDAKLKADFQVMQTELETMFATRSAEEEASRAIHNSQTQAQQATFSAQEDAKRSTFAAKQSAAQAKAKAKPKESRNANV